MEQTNPPAGIAGWSRDVLEKKKKERYFYVYMHVQLNDILVSQHCIVSAECITDVKGHIYTDNYSIRVMRALPVAEVYKDFNPGKQVFKDLLADGKAMKKRLHGLSKTVNPNIFQEQQ